MKFRGHARLQHSPWDPSQFPPLSSPPPRPPPRPLPGQSSQSVVLVPLEVRGRHGHGFTAQERGAAQSSARAGHVRDGRRIWRGVSEGQRVLRSPSACRPSPSRPLSPPRTPLPRPRCAPFRARAGGGAGRLTVDGDQHAAAVGRRVHPVVGHALVLPRLAALDVGNLKDLALRDEAVCGGGRGRGRGRTPTLNTGQHGQHNGTHISGAGTARPGVPGSAEAEGAAGWVRREEPGLGTGTQGGGAGIWGSGDPGIWDL